jgi:hypothetical protein
VCVRESERERESRKVERRLEMGVGRDRLKDRESEGRKREITDR